MVGCAAVGSGLTGGAPRTLAVPRPVAVRSTNPRQRGAYWRASDAGASTLPFPTARNATPGRRTRGRGRGGVTHYDNPPSPARLEQLRDQWFQGMRARGASREEVEGRILAAGLSPESPRWQRILDQLWGPRAR